MPKPGKASKRTAQARGREDRIRRVGEQAQGRSGTNGGDEETVTRGAIRSTDRHEAGESAQPFSE